MRFPPAGLFRRPSKMLGACAAAAVMASVAGPPPPGTAPRAVIVVPTISRVRISTRSVRLDAARCRDLARYFDATREVASVRAEWTWTTTSRAGGDRVAITVDPEYILTMPRWTALSVQPSLERAAIAIHEQGHIDIFLAELKRLRETLASIAQPSLEATLAEIDARLAAFKEKLTKRQDDYDRHTQHGIVQGAILECP